MEIMTRIESLSPHLKMKQDVEFRLVKEIPASLTKEIQLAVMDFIKSSHMPKGVDETGFYYQTLQTLANAAVLNAGGDLWLGTKDGHLVAYVLGHINNDYDGRLNYMVSQAWVRKDQRGDKWVKDAWAKIRARAQACFCKHFSVISSREPTAAYCRFLGRGFHKYAEILKEEI